MKYVKQLATPLERVRGVTDLTYNLKYKPLEFMNQKLENTVWNDIATTVCKIQRRLTGRHCISVVYVGQKRDSWKKSYIKTWYVETPG